MMEKLSEVVFRRTTLSVQASAIYPFMPDADELKRGLLNYIDKNHKGLLECKVEGLMA